MRLYLKRACGYGFEIYSSVDFDFVSYTEENLARFENEVFVREMGWPDVNPIRSTIFRFYIESQFMDRLPSRSSYRYWGRHCRFINNHLAKLGYRDVLLLERHQLTSGSTWHAAGLVGQLRSQAGITQLLGNSISLYNRLEKKQALLPVGR